MNISSSDFEVTIPSLLFDPEFYLFDFSLKGSKTKFLVAKEDLQAQAPFVDIRFEPFAQGKFSIDTKSLFRLEGQHDIERPKIHFIFHHAFVCSTLLARCLNQSQAFFSLKEPWILRRMADFKRSRARTVPGSHWQEMFLKNVSLLSKNYSTGDAVVIKATNIANNLLEDVLTRMPDSRVVYLYSDLGSFLTSNLKKSAETQGKIPALYKGFCGDSDFLQQFKQFRNTSGFSFLQICGLTWLVNIYNLQAVMDNRQTKSFITLEMQSLLNTAENTLARVSSFFGHVPDEKDRARMIHPDIMGKNAKYPRQSYSRDIKQAEANQVFERYGSEIETVVTWLEPVIRELGLMAFLEKHAGLRQ